VARQLKEMNCPAKVVFLSVHEDLEFVRAAAEVGALAYVCKSSIDNDLVDAIYSATVNKMFFPILFASDL
jgi:DNA-binding NarL/FixJ family response regulator